MHDLSLFTRHLDSCSPLEQEDRDAILSLPHEVRTLVGTSRLIYPSQSQSTLLILTNGFCLRQKHTSRGGRHISALNIAGDALNLSAMFLDGIDYDLEAISGATVAVIPKEAVTGLFRDRPAVINAAFSSALVDASIGREWLLNQARRNSRARVGHFICEHSSRMLGRGLGAGSVIDLGVTQDQLADVLGLTPVHVNRTLRALEADGLIARKGRRFEIKDMLALRAEADFNPMYLYSSVGEVAQG